MTIKRYSFVAPALALALLTCGGSLLACGGKGSSSASSGATTHAPAGAVPGSHEDWCGEHAVPESKCTRCNQSLIPAFKATNDWCTEHSLPESQCLACHPDLKIERPPKASGT